MQNPAQQKQTINKAFNQTPCVGRCSTVYGDAICRGCKRFMTEVCAWNQYSLAERASVWQRLDLLAQRIIPEYVVIQSEEQLSAFMKDQTIRYPQHVSTSSWALHCIENFPGNLSQLDNAGLKLAPGAASLKTIKDLRLAVQKSLYALSMAQKQRQEQEPQTTR